MKPAQVPLVYLAILWARDSPPSIPAKTNSKSDKVGGTEPVKSVSGVMSFGSVSFGNCPIHYGIFFGGKPAKHQAEKGRPAR